MSTANQQRVNKPDELEVPAKQRHGRFAWCGRYISSEDSFVYPYRMGSSLEQVGKPGKPEKVDSELTLTFAIADAGETCFSCAGVQNLPVCGRLCSCCVKFCRCCNCRNFFNLTSFVFILILIGIGAGLMTYGIGFEECWHFKKLYTSVAVIMFLCVTLYFSSLIFDRKELRKHMQFMLYPWILLCCGLIGALIYALAVQIVTIQYFVTMIIPIVGIGGYALGELFLTIERQRLRPLLIHEMKLLKDPLPSFETEDDDEGWTSRTISLHGMHEPITRGKTTKMPKTAPQTTVSHVEAGTSRQSTSSAGRRQAAGQGGGSGDAAAASKDRLRLFNYHKGKLSIWQARRFRVRHHNSDSISPNVFIDPTAPEPRTSESPPLTRVVPLALLPASSVESLEESDTSASRLLSHNAWYESENLRTSPPVTEFRNTVARSHATTLSSSTNSYPTTNHVRVHLPPNQQTAPPN